jgi:glycosyltransferase involved in cell wall biosynthesis
VNETNAKKTPLISVIICCYNSANYVEKCLSSLQEQTYKNLEIIVVNDGSVDDTGEILEKFAKEKKLLVVTTENKGVASARNTGLKQITGEYFTFVDSDDVVDKNHVLRLYSLIEKTDAEMSVCGIKRIKEKRVKNLKLEKKFNSSLETFEKKDGINQYFSQKKFDYVLWNKMYKTEVLKKSGAVFLDGLRYGEESYFIFSYLKCVEKIAYANAKTYYYVKQKNSLMNQDFNEKRFDIYSNVKAILDKMEGYEEVEPYVRSLRSNYSVGLLYLMKKSGYKNPEKVREVINLLKSDVKHLKKCKKVALYRRLLIPLIPAVAKIVFARQMRKQV